jgi:3-methyladenine DNA glycosylase AlkD
MSSLAELKKDFSKLANPRKAEILQRFFKTRKGEYAEGDVFLGVIVPEQRKLVKKYTASLSLNNLQELLNTKIHEYRLTALLILVSKYEKDSEKRKEIFEFYLNNTKNINNWDLVDLSAPRIVGEHLINKDRDLLNHLAKSNSLWERRIAVLSSFAFIRNNQFDDAINISEMLLKDKHDLIHKAVGWMLREIGKRDIGLLKQFMGKHYKSMPRTMLRYAIEKFPEKERKAYLEGTAK